MSANNRVHKSNTQNAIYQSQHLNDIRKDVREIKNGIVGDENEVDIFLNRHSKIQKISNHAQIDMLKANEMANYGGGGDNTIFSLIDPIEGQSRTHFSPTHTNNNGIINYSTYRLRVKSTSANDNGKTIFLDGIQDLGSSDGKTTLNTVHLTFGADSSVFHDFPANSIHFVNQMRVGRLNNTTAVTKLEGEIMLEAHTDNTKFVKTITSDHHSDADVFKYTKSSINEFHIPSDKILIVNEIHIDYQCSDDIFFIFNVASYKRGSASGLNEEEHSIFKKITHLNGSSNKVLKIDKVVNGGEHYQLFVSKKVSSNNSNIVHCSVNGFLVDK